MCRLSGPGRLAPIGWWFHHTHNDHSDRFQSDTIQHRCTVAVTVQVDGSTGSCQASVSLCMYSYWCAALVCKEALAQHSEASPG